MPPQGGGDFEDLEIGRAVVYLANSGGAKFPVPERAGRAAPARRSGAARCRSCGIRPLPLAAAPAAALGAGQVGSLRPPLQQAARG